MRYSGYDIMRHGVPTLKHLPFFTSSHVDDAVVQQRRRFLMGVGAAALSSGALPPLAQAGTAGGARLKTKARIVIAGGGAAGLTAASHLAAGLDGASIVMIDARKAHY